MTVSRWLVRLAMAASAVFSAFFIARTAFRMDGKLSFTLFDDAMISMRYARNLAEGRGLIWDAGQEPLEGFTNFLWTVWMAALHWLPLPDRLTPLAVSISGAALLVVSVWLSARIARQLLPESPVAPVIAAALTASSYPLAYWTLRGMEVGLISVFASASVLMVLRLRESVTQRRLWTLGALLSLAVLTRVDALIIALVLVAATFVLVPAASRRRLVLPLVALPVLTLLAHTGFRLAYYGELVPNTYTLKVQEIAIDNRLKRGVKVLLDLLFKGGMLVGVAAAVAAAVVGLRHKAPVVLAPLALVAAFGAYSIYVGGDAWEQLGFANRYVSVVLPVLFALVAVGVASLQDRARLVAGVLGAGVIVTSIGARFTVPAADGFSAARTTTTHWFNWGSVVIALTVLAVLLFTLRKPLVRAMVPAAIAITVGIAMMTNVAALEGWARGGAEWSERDSESARYGMVLGKATPPGTRIAMSTAGNLGYFAGPDRVFIDELGKMDPVIATMAPNRPDLPPGHQKWDYRYTFEVLRPDLVSEVFAITEEDAARLQGLGYVRIGDDAFVRPGAEGIDVDALRRYYDEREARS